MSFKINSYVLAIASVFGSGVAHAGSFNLGFAAPAIFDRASVANPETGAIVYDQTADAFYGFSSTGSWHSLDATSSVPAGTITAFGGSTAPTGYFLCDGAAVSRTTYANLFAVLGTTYGAGDGSTTFNLPNLAGVFPRGAGSQTISSVVYSATLGASQRDQLQGHLHVQQGYSPGGGTTVMQKNGGSGAQGPDGNNTTTQGPSSDGTNGAPRIGNETRPANVAVNYIIKT